MIAPTLLLDTRICQSNIHRMADRAKAADVDFTPHFKTHQSNEVGRWFRAFGVHSIKVSSLKMARYFAEDGWESITIAFPCNIHWVDQLNELAQKIDLKIIVNSAETAQYLDQHLETSLRVYIEVDTGNRRSGLWWDDPESLTSLAQQITQSEHLGLYGLYTHAGQTYNADTVVEVKALFTDTAHKLNRSRAALSDIIPEEELTLCTGDTPGCSLSEELGLVDEISPGNFVFYDLMQHYLGACDVAEIAVALRCPVVDIYHDRKQIVIHGGAVHLSKDTITWDERPIYGMVAERSDQHWKLPDHPSPVISLSQEHGIIKARSRLLESVSIGDTLDLLPVHSCLTANLMHRYQLIENGQTIEHLEATR